MNSQEAMVWEIKKKYGLDSPRVFSAMLQVPREEFVSKSDKDLAYSNAALSIGHGQTISQPYTVALMTHLLNLGGDEKVLEIGTGSGYQAAILSYLADKVYSVEIIPELAKEAKARLKRLGFKKVEVKIADGEVGWEEKSPFDAIIVTAGMNKVPKKLLAQLKVGGVLVAPVGLGSDKVMTKFIKRDGGKIEKNKFGIFHFVPFVKRG